MSQSVVHAAKPDRAFPSVGRRDEEADEVSTGAVEIMPALRAYAISLTRDKSRADDLVQDTLVKMIDNRDTFRLGSNIRAWAFTILRHCHINTVRRPVNRPTDELVETHCVSEGAQEWRMENLDLQAALKELPPEQRQVVVLVGALGLSYDEAAKACNCADGTIKSRLFRGRAWLARRLGRRGAGQGSLSS